MLVAVALLAVQFALFQLALLHLAHFAHRLLPFYLLLKVPLVIISSYLLTLSLKRRVQLDTAQHVLLLHQPPPIGLAFLDRTGSTKFEAMFGSAARTQRKVTHRTADLHAAGIFLRRLPVDGDGRAFSLLGDFLLVGLSG